MLASSLKFASSRGALSLAARSLSTAVTPVKHYVLLYSFVENMVERRAPHRAEHLQVCSDFLPKGLLLGGAFSPAEGGMLVFRTEDKAVVQDFVSKDPYVTRGLVTKSEIKEWNVVVGTAM